MSKTSVLSTRILLICAAVGVAIGLVSVPWAGLHALVIATYAPLYGFVLGFHALPGVIAQQVVRGPWVALITHAIVALVGVAFLPTMGRSYLLAAIIFGGAQELISALTRYRHWETWRFLLSGLVTGVILAIPMWFVFKIASFGPLNAIVFVAGFLLGPVLWTLVGLAIGSGLRKAGITPRKKLAASPSES